MPDYVLWREYAGEEDTEDTDAAEEFVGLQGGDPEAEDEDVTDGVLALEGAEDDWYAEMADQSREELQRAMQAVGSPA